MKIQFLIVSFLWCILLCAQNSILVPPDNVRMAFEKQYPQKKAIWSMEYGANEDNLKFIANFTQSNTTKAIAVYNSKGVFKAYKTQISIEKLPLNAKKNLAKDYSKSVKQVFFVVDEKNDSTYEVGVAKDKKNYIVVFDKKGNLKKRIQIE